MKIILHSETMENKGEKLKKIIQDQLPGTETKVSTGIETLKQYLCKPLNGISVAVLMISSIEDFEQLLSIQSFFDNIKLILIVSEKMKRIMPKGFQLNPCYISYPGSDLNDIVIVLKTIKKRLYESKTKHN